MPITVSDLSDMVATTLPKLGRLEFTDNISNYRNTIALQRLINDKSEKPTSGSSLQFRVMYDHNHSFRNVPPGYTAVVDITQQMTYGDVPWRISTWNWAMEANIAAMNSGPEKIVDMIIEQRTAGQASAVEGFERILWRVPASTDTTTPYGLPYYIVKSATATTTNNGFNGTVPSGYTTVANLSPTTYTRWRNYAGPYTVISQEDLVAAIDKAMTFTDFKPIVKNIPQYAGKDDVEMYTNYNVQYPLKQIAKAQNENLGFDLDPADGRVRYRGAKIVEVPELMEDTTNPVYGVNWAAMMVGKLKGMWMSETVFDALPSQPTVMYTNVNCTWNLKCVDRRKQFVLSNGTDMPA